MSQCNPSVLVSSEYFNISICKCCKRIGLFYKNLLVGFDIKEFTHFCQGVANLDFYSNCVYFPNAKPYVVIETCHPDIQFGFEATEFEELKSILDESMLMLEVHQALEIKK